MSALGRLAYRFRTKYRHGLRTAYYRDVIRPQILQTPAITNTCSNACEIHVLTSTGDWLNLIWTLKSFYHFSRCSYALCIHDDGTLTDEARVALLNHFPKARLISRADADEAVLLGLAAYPLCADLRRTNTLSLKVFDFNRYLHADRMLLLDSDILFFAEPRELLLRIENADYLKNTVNEDLSSAYTVGPDTVKQILGFELQPRFNSGIGLIQKSSLRLDWIEEFLQLPEILGHFWRIEQTLYALSSSRFGVELLPEEYRVHLGDIFAGAPCRHYIGAIRHLFYNEGLRILRGRDFLQSLHESPAGAASAVGETV